MTARSLCTPYWLDHLQWRIEERSAEEIVPELQALAVGDRVPDSRDRGIKARAERRNASAREAVPA